MSLNAKAGREVMVKANQLKRVVDEHGVACVSKVNRGHMKRFLSRIIRDIDKVE